jgi:hypothetical protein
LSNRPAGASLKIVWRLLTRICSTFAETVSSSGPVRHTESGRRFPSCQQSSDTRADDMSVLDFVEVFMIYIDSFGGRESGAEAASLEDGVKNSGAT